MNIALENTEEYVDGRLKNTYGDTFIRGNNGMKHGAQIRFIAASNLISLPFFLDSVIYQR